MIYNSGFTDENYIKTILNYHYQYDLNLNEIANVFSVKKDSLIKFLNACFKNKNITKNDKNEIMKILNTEKQECRKRRTFIAKFFYEKEIKLNKDAKELKKRSNDKNYEFTEDDLLLMSRYRVNHRYSMHTISEIFGINVSRLHRYEKNIYDPELKSQLQALNEDYDYKNDNRKIRK